MDDPEPFYHVSCLSETESPDPRRKLETALNPVSELIRDAPTIPADPENPAQPWHIALSETSAVKLPAKHCAFKGCSWVCKSDRERIQHLRNEHTDSLSKITKHMPCGLSDEFKMSSAYNEAIATKIRQGAPLVTYSIERRMIMMYMNHVKDDKQIQAPICLFCGCKFVYVQDRHCNRISWEKPFTGTEKDKNVVSHLFALNMVQTKDAFSLEKYLEDYGLIQASSSQAETVHLKDHLYEFEDWILEIPFQNYSTNTIEQVTIICCPEDKRCTRKECQKKPKVACLECSFPVCNECKGSLNSELEYEQMFRNPPARALSNDLMTFYAPKTMYECNMTVMEMICSSVCITSMICFSMEVKYGHLLDTTVHKQDNRVAARGNATTFQMPWQSILSELKRTEARQDSNKNTDLPLTGKDLRSVVQVLLKCSDDTQKTAYQSSYTKRAYADKS